MGKKIAISTDAAPSPAGPYSQAIIANGFVFVAGQRPADAQGVLKDGIKEQTEQCILNIEAILKEAGSSLENIVKSNVYLSDIKYFAEMNEVYSVMMPQPYPTRTTVGTQLRNILVEIEVMATVGSEPVSV